MLQINLILKVKRSKYYWKLNKTCSQKGQALNYIVNQLVLVKYNIPNWEFIGLDSGGDKKESSD